MKFRLISISLFMTFSFFLIAQGPYMVTPSISPDGSHVAFSYQGDIWTAPSDGGLGRRLTVHSSYEAYPQWSPDGQMIAFQSNRWDNEDIYIMSANGGKPRRLTYHSTNDILPQWYGNQSVTFLSRRAYQQIERTYEVHQVSIEGGTPSRITDAMASTASISPDGNLLAFETKNCRIARETYTGPANRDIWIHNMSEDSYHIISDQSEQEIYPQWAGDYLYYLSAENGKYNIHRKVISNSGISEFPAEKITEYEKEGLTYFDVNSDGSVLVFEKGGKIYKWSNGAAALINVNVPSDSRDYDVIYEKVNDGASSYSVSESEDRMALSIKGDIFIKDYDSEKKRLVQLTQHPFRDKEPHWINDHTLIFSSDRDGQFDLYALSSAEVEKDLFKSMKTKVKKIVSSPDEDEEISVSPDKTKIAFRRGRGKLIVADLSLSGNVLNEKTLIDGWDIPRDIAWSPDSKWIAYAYRDLHFNTEIYVQPANGGKPTNVSLHPRVDRSPVWSRDGSKLGFLSNRNNGDTDVWFVWLKKEDWEKTKRDWDDTDAPDDDEKVVVTIDFEDIHERLEQVTRMAGNEGDLTISKDGQTFYFTTNGGGRQGSPGKPVLMSAKWDGTEIETVTSDGDIFDVNLDKGGKNLIAINRRGLPVVIDLKKSKTVKHSISGSIEIDKKSQRLQVFEEGWRRLRDGFYDPEFHGRDFAALKEAYRDRCLNASTDEDFKRYYNQMLGQLDASHMGMRGGSPDNHLQEDNTGLVGIEVEPVSGGVRIKKVVPNTPADRKESKLHIGEVITAVNGTSLKDGHNFYSLLNNANSDLLLFNIRAANGANREVKIRPVNSIRTALYESWIKERKQLVNEYSGGRLGYIHIRGMNWSSFERFERELTASGLGKDGLVIDVRYNGGGWTTDMLMTVLNVRQHSFTIPRGAVASLEKEKKEYLGSYPFGERLPFSAVTVPSIALCNESSYSNAEIFSHAFQSLGLGTLVGQPTFGAVISTGSSRLMDGSYVRMPYRAWYVKKTEKNMEHGPAVPDIIVADPPAAKGKGEDPQLKRAVDELLNQLGE